jgi:6-pyruvoyltetrahydropterin/6-carboxytetrahydropterin synthase
MKIEISKEFEISASHILPWHSGKCSRMHGHNYRIIIYASNHPSELPLSENGIVMDFGDITDLFKREIEDRYDHRHLNDFFPNPTAEILAWTWLHDLNVLDSRISAVKVYETAKCSAEARIR